MVDGLHFTWWVTLRRLVDVFPLSIMLLTSTVKCHRTINFDICPCSFFMVRFQAIPWKRSRFISSPVNPVTMKPIQQLAFPSAKCHCYLFSIRRKIVLFYLESTPKLWPEEAWDAHQRMRKLTSRDTKEKVTLFNILTHLKISGLWFHRFTQERYYKKKKERYIQGQPGIVKLLLWKVAPCCQDPG